MSDIDDNRAATNTKLIEMIAEMRAEVYTGIWSGSMPDGTDANEAMRLVLGAFSDGRLACFVATCVGEWVNRYGGSPQLCTIAGVPVDTVKISRDAVVTCGHCKESFAVVFFGAEPRCEKCIGK